MAKAQVISVDNFIRDISKLGYDFKALAGPALYEGAGILADELRAKIQALPERDGKVFIKDGQMGKGVTPKQKQALLDNMGIARMRYTDGTYQIKIGFEGYIDPPTKSYPRGTPVSMIARAVESGTSFLQKTPFIKPAYNSAKEKAEKAMTKSLEDTWSKYGGGK